MSVPYEVWIDKDGDPVLHTRGDYAGCTRYLRADLTCRNCALFPYPKKCSHSFIVDGDVFTPIASSPACMAFAPKEQK